MINDDDTDTEDELLNMPKVIILEITLDFVYKLKINMILIQFYLKIV